MKPADIKFDVCFEYGVEHNHKDSKFKFYYHVKIKLEIGQKKFCYD